METSIPLTETARRRMSHILTGLFILLAFGAQSVRAGPPDSTFSLFRRSVSLVIVPGQETAVLPDLFIISGSDSLFTDTRPLIRDRDYTLDYTDGGVLFRNTPVDTLRLTIRYERLPVSLTRRHARRKLAREIALPDSAPLPALRPTGFSSNLSPGASSSSSTLRVGGSKSIGITTGTNRDAGLEQSLRIQISGRAAKDVEVLALLSDRSNPIQPDGNTRQLSELDQVLVQVKTPRAATTMGDYTLSLDGPLFARYNRRLKGIRGEAQTSAGSFQVAAAVSEAKYTSITFQGIEGVQGPYPLTDEQGSRNILIVSGTEKVWVDGVMMIRGEEGDYTIDYNRAEITFTRRRLITGDSRVVADFEASDQQYPRQVYLGRGVFSLAGRTTVGTTFIREGDDRDSPRSLTLSAEDIGVLQKSAASSSGAALPGARFVGPGRGDYEQERDEGNRVDYYRYTGPGGGSYQVSFSRTPEGGGMYTLNTNGSFEYRGPGGGNYQPEVFVTLPSSQSLAGIDVRSEPVDGVEIEGEWAYSARNPNTFVPSRPGQTRHGQALRLSTRFTPSPLTLGALTLGQVTFSGVARSVDHDFQPAGRIDEAEYHRRYDQGSENAWQGRLIELGATHRLGSFLTVDGQMGRLNRPDGFLSNRQEFSLDAAPFRESRIAYRFERIHSRTPSTAAVSPDETDAAPTVGRWTRQQADASVERRGLAPRVGFRQEQRTGGDDGSGWSGQRFFEWETGLETRRWKRFSMLSEFSLRHNDRLAARTTDATAWTRDSVSRTFRQRAAYRDGGAFSASAQFIRRSRVEYRENRTRSADHLIDGRALYSSLSRFMTLDARYEVSSVRSAQTSRQYIRVERGRGDFRLDPAIGEFLPDPDGEYIERFDRAGDFVPVTRVYSSLRFELQPYRTLPASRNGFSGVIRHVSTDTYLSVDERSKTPDRRSLYLLRLSRFQRDSTTVSGNMTFRQDIVLFPQSRNFSLRLRYQRNSALNNQLITGSERRIHSEYGLRLRLPVSGSVAAEVELLRQIRQRRDFGRDRFRIHTTVGSVSLAHRPTPPLELLIRLQGGYDRDVMNGISTGQYGVVPGMSYAFRGRGRARFEFDWTHVRVAPSTAFPPFEMAGGRRPGNSARWLGNVDYRIGRNLSLLMHYDGRKDPRRPLIHTARMEMQAYF